MRVVFPENKEWQTNGLAKKLARGAGLIYTFTFAGGHHWTSTEAHSQVHRHKYSLSVSLSVVLDPLPFLLLLLALSAPIWVDICIQIVLYSVLRPGQIATDKCVCVLVFSLLIVAHCLFTCRSKKWKLQRPTLALLQILCDWQDIKDKWGEKTVPVKRATFFPFYPQQVGIPYSLLLLFASSHSLYKFVSECGNHNLKWPF